MALDLYLDGVRYLRPPEPVQAPPSSAAAPVSSPSATPASATAPMATAAQTAAANQGATNNRGPGAFTPQGIQQFALQQGDSFWALLAKQNQSVVDKNALSDDAELRKNLAATPWLDQQEFGNRPANKPCTLNHMPIDGTVTLLDSTRLGYLNQQRQALGDAERLLATPAGKKLLPDDRAAVIDGIEKPILDEIVYASSGTGIVSADALDKIVEPIAARAPNDALFQSAIGKAKQQVLGNVENAAKTFVENTTLGQGVVTAADVDKILGPMTAAAPNDSTFQSAIAQAKKDVLADMQKFGRTPDQLGQLLKDAASGNTDQLKGDLQAQLYCVGDAAQKDSQGNLVAAATAIDVRAGVYLTYLGANKGAIQDAIATAKQQVTVDRPVQSLIDAYTSKGGGVQGAAAFAAKLHELTDLAPGAPDSVKISQEQVQAIMQKLSKTSVTPDGTLSVFKTVANDLTSGMAHAWTKNASDSTTKAAQAGLRDLSAAMQTVFESDGPPLKDEGTQQPKPGKAIVDQVASELYASIQDNTAAYDAIAGSPAGWFADSAKNGNVALAASMAAQFAGTPPPAHFSQSGLRQSATDAIVSALDAGFRDYQNETLTPLDNAYAADYGVLNMGNDSYGNLKSASAQADMKSKASSLPSGGDKAAQDERQLSDAQRRVGQVQWTLQDYAAQVGLPLDGAAVQTSPALREFGGLMSSVNDLQKATGIDKPNLSADNVSQVQFWWQSRVGTSATVQLAKTFGNYGLSKTTDGSTMQSALKALVGDSASGRSGLVGGLAKGLMGPLFLLNAANTYGSLDQISGVQKGAFAGFAAIYAGVGVSMTADTLFPDWKTGLFGKTADGKAAATPMRKSLDWLIGKVGESSVSDTGKTAFKTAIGTVRDSASDVLGPIVAGIGTLTYLDTAATDPIHGTAFGLATVGDFAPAAGKQFLANASEETLDRLGLAFLNPDDLTVMGLGINVLAAGSQYIGNAIDAAHATDQELTHYLIADGVTDADVAKSFATHMTVFVPGGAVDAGNGVTGYFNWLRQNDPKMAGKSDAELDKAMVDWMNTFKAGDVGGIHMSAGAKADAVANFVKREIRTSRDKDGHNVIKNPDQIAVLQNMLKQMDVPLS